MNLVKYIAVSLTAFNLFACTDSFLEDVYKRQVVMSIYELTQGYVNVRKLG